MKISTRILALSLIVSAGSCLTMNAETVSVSETKAAVTKNQDKAYGLNHKALLEYFGGKDNVKLPSARKSKVELSDIEEARRYVWKAWKDYVASSETELLPPLTDHSNVASWNEVAKPDTIWKVPEGDMYVFYGTKGQKPADGYPLIIFLHGSGDDAMQEWHACLGHSQAFLDGPSVYFLPKSPQGGTGTRWFQPSKQRKWEQLLRQALTSGVINPEKVYFAGISEGAYGSQRLASFYADYLAGAGPIAGGELLFNCPPENLANTAFCLQTGEKDVYWGRTILTEKVGKILDSLAVAHPGYYAHKVDLQPNMGHGCDYYVATPWLIKYKRNATPKYFYWENYGMGDINNEPRRYRDAFYNLRIMESADDRSDPMRREAFEMKIDGNTVNIKADIVTLTTCEPATPPTGELKVGVSKTKTPATKGSLRIYLSDELVDLSKPVTINVNGKRRFQGKLKRNAATMAESCRLFFDPMRLFTASVDVKID